MSSGWNGINAPGDAPPQLRSLPGRGRGRGRGTAAPPPAPAPAPALRRRGRSGGAAPAALSKSSLNIYKFTARLEYITDANGP